MLQTWILLIGFAQLGVLVASALVPFQLNWREALRPLPKLHRQMYLVYGGYVVLGILALGLTCIFCAEQLAQGSPLARAFCIYGASFWGIRLALQGVFDAKPFLTKWWTIAGYHLLSAIFILCTAVYIWAAAGSLTPHPPSP